MSNKLSTWWRKYRIIEVDEMDYECSVWRIWFPFWISIKPYRWFRTKDDAIRACRVHAKIEAEEV